MWCQWAERNRKDTGGTKHGWEHLYFCPLPWDVKEVVSLSLKTYLGLRGWFVKKHRLGHQVCWGDPVRNMWCPEAICGWIWGWKLAVLISRNKTVVVLKGKQLEGMNEMQTDKSFLLLRYSQLCLLSGYYSFTSCRELSLRLISVTYIGKHH